jgi:hypothetical protein
MPVLKGGRWTAAVVVLIGVVATAGCGGGPAASPSPSPSGMSDAQLQVLVNNLVQCVRQHGAPGMPDVPVRNGHIALPDENTIDQATRQNVEAARAACKAVEDRIPTAVLQNSSDRQGAPNAADVPKMRQFAQCMRQNGEPTWPDPNADGTFPGGDQIMARGKTVVGPKIKICQKYYDGPIRFSS